MSSETLYTQGRITTEFLMGYLEKCTLSNTPILRDDIEAIVIGGMCAAMHLQSDIMREMVPARAPDWEDLHERYFDPGCCDCVNSPPCSYCVDGWQKEIDWEHERVTTGYVEELDGFEIATGVLKIDGVDVQPGEVHWVVNPAPARIVHMNWVEFPTESSALTDLNTRQMMAKMLEE